MGQGRALMGLLTSGGVTGRVLEGVVGCQVLFWSTYQSLGSELKLPRSLHGYGHLHLHRHGHVGR